MLAHNSGKFLIGKILTSKTEIRDVLKAWIAISIAFGVLLSSGSIFALTFWYSFGIAALTVGIGFLFHELAHKLVAQRYGCFAEFRSFDSFLILSIAMSFFGFVFAAPGAVMVQGPVGVRRNGWISVAGPITNIFLAIIFLSILFLFPYSSIHKVAYYGAYINSMLALFNMLPFLNFDGAKVWPWNKPIFFSVIGIAGILMVTLSYLRP